MPARGRPKKPGHDPATRLTTDIHNDLAREVLAAAVEDGEASNTAAYIRKLVRLGLRFRNLRVGHGDAPVLVAGVNPSSPWSRVA